MQLKRQLPLSKASKSQQHADATNFSFKQEQAPLKQGAPHQPDQKQSDDTKHGQTYLQLKISLIDIIRKVKLKHICSIFLEKLESRKLKKLNEVHYNIISDKSSRHAYYKKKNLWVKQYLFCKYLMKKFKVLGLILGKVPIFTPLSTYKLLWDSLIVLFICMYLIVIPLSVAYMKLISYFISSELNHYAASLLLLNVLIQLNTSYFQHGSLVVQRKQILINYLKNNFISQTASLIVLWMHLYIEQSQREIRADDFDIYDNRYFLLIFFTQYPKLVQFYRQIENRFKINR